ncbi:Hypothetical protein I595_530 [Croceitalea dokdonensis DOKDO 023]|uniref:DUF4252 domain-containing protein n=1 Tax=Croceitalea dokdonensis DOKDO 023 TaxID=1300341 RepID=A0A0P7AXT1_9FLAO|nr:DUF4252 domain-containing protein [Croceitalea dokdonensis]KPM33626.1 Hypothetical protein I595_530 [Croceitalea dokdonensis DOKDO 023]
MKYFFVTIAFMLPFGCGSYNTIDSFYEIHKNDDQVTAVRVPKFMFSLLSKMSPEMQSLIGNTRDLRYMKFPSVTPSQTNFLNDQMNAFGSGSFIEVFRKNDESKRNVVSIRERRDVVKEILIYNNDNVFGSFLYFNGNFDPNQVRKLANNNNFQELSNTLVPQLNLNQPVIED